MSDIGAPAAPSAPAAPAAPAADTPASPPLPIRNEPLQKEPVEKKPEPKRSIRDIAKDAKAAVEKADSEGKEPPRSLKDEPKPKTETQPKVEAKTEPATDKTKAETPTADPAKGPQRAPDGKFAASEPKPDAPQQRPARSPLPENERTPPQRFTQEARAEWESVPETTRREIHRAFRELEGGIQKYKGGHDAYEATYKAYDELARQSNVDAKATLDGYINIDRALSNPQTFMKGMEAVLQSKGVTPLQYAQAIMRAAGQQQGGQPQNGQQQPQPPSPEVAELRRTVADLQRQLGGVTQHVQTQQQGENERVLAEWAADKPHFNQLRSRIAELVSSDGLSPDDAYVKALTEARDQARLLLGDSGLTRQQPQTPAPGAVDDPAAHTLKGTKSIAGAPTAGSDPATSKPASTIREAIKRAMAQV